MSLLFDANLSPRLVARLSADFPGSLHVEVVGLTASDDTVWNYALEHGLTVITKDNDFLDRAALCGPPGKVVVLTMGNCLTSIVEDVLLQNASQLRGFMAHPVPAVT